MIPALLSLFALSCANDGNTSLPELGTKVFHASISDTRLYLDRYEKLKWNAGDFISVFGSSANEQYSFNGETGDNVGTFSNCSSTVPPTFSSYYAVFPYTTETTSTKEGEIFVTLPEKQHFSSGQFPDNLMVAVTSSLQDDNLKFKNVCGYLKLNLFRGKKHTIKSITVKGNNNEILTGAALVTASKEGRPHIQMKGNGQSVTLDLGEGVTLGQSKETATPFWFVLPPVEFSSGITIEVKDTSDQLSVKSTDKRIVISENTVQPINPFSVAYTYTEINGTTIDMANNLVGLITDSATGNPIAGVPVTDGFHYTKTDANGVYQMKADDRALVVCYSLPSSYRSPLDEQTHLPKFYANDLDLSEQNRRDFVLEKITPQNDFSLAAIGDVHIGRDLSKVSTETKRYRENLLGDICKTYAEGIASGKYNENVYAITLGDLTNDNRPEQWEAYYNSILNLTLPGSGKYLPLYNVIGNHDHRNSDEDTFGRRRNYIKYLGPTNYSVNIGSAHIICVDNHSGSHNISEDDYQWIVEDIKQVEDPGSKLVILCGHVPYRDGGSHDGSSSASTHRADIMNQLCKFHQAHIFVGHTHRVQEWINNNFKTAGGYPVYEHIHAMCGGHYWFRKISPDGSPFAYTIYTISGKEIVDFQFKPGAFDTSYQMRVYDGDQQIINPSSKTFYWYTNTLVDSSSGYYAYGNPCLKNSFVVTAWKSDTANWKMEFWQDGKYVADLKRVPSDICDVFTASWFYAGNGGNKDCVRTDTQHYFYYTPASGKPSEQKNWTIKAIHTVPSSKSVKHTYECSEFTTTYDGFAWN